MDHLFQNFGMKHDLPYLKSCWVDKIENSDLENILAKMQHTTFLIKD